MVQVSIGLPVYNGENYLEEAIHSVLEQTYTDFELVISDNASTDRTAEICRDYASTDQRIRYLCNEHNLGAAPNYNLAWNQCSGKYFKWLAHDDRLLPEYVAATVTALEKNPNAVLCNTTVEYIGSKGEHLGNYQSVMEHAGSDNPAARLSAMILRSHTCIDFFGMIQREAMKNSLLHQAFSGADKAFLAQMALRGRLLQLNEPLVQMREHPDRYTRQTKSAQMKLAWHDTSLTKKRDIPVLNLYRTYRNLVETESLSEAERRACFRVLRRFWFSGWNGGRLTADILSIPFPQAIDIAFNIKHLLFGAPGNFHR
jgi:glycosyltransferase involved in cell wall biosynthesis